MYLNLSGYHLTYDQEFSNGTPFTVSPDGTVEFKSQFDWGGRSVTSNDEAEYYSDPSYGLNPFSNRLGMVTITAQATPEKFLQQAEGLPYVSGLLTTQNTFSQHGGYFEMRARVAGGSGLWPAFWMLPTTGQDYPELDIIEDPNLNGPTQYWVHATGQDNGGGGFVNTGKTLDKAFHTYGVEWNDTTVTFYFDGKAISEAGTPTDFAGLNFYLLVNLAVGGQGSWPGTPGASSIPAKYDIDYIRAYSTNPAVPAVPLQPISSPDHANTTPVYTPPVMPTVTTGTGTHQLVLNVGEDYFQADAQFAVLVDGVRVGGVFTTPAEKAQGLVQQFVFNGNWAAGAHTVTVNFFNAVNYGPNFQRNLYIENTTLDGLPVQGGTLTMTSAGKQSFSFVVPPASPAP